MEPDWGYRMGTRSAKRPITLVPCGSLSAVCRPFEKGCEHEISRRRSQIQPRDGASKEARSIRADLFWWIYKRACGIDVMREMRPVATQKDNLHKRSFLTGAR